MISPQDLSAVLSKLLQELQEYLSKEHPNRIFTTIPEIASLCLSQDVRIKELQEDNTRMARALAFAQSMILSGERMTETAQKIFDEALTPSSHE